MPKERYYQSGKDRKDESRGMKYAMDNKNGMNDSGMISSDYSAIANLPQQVMMKEYPKSGYGYADGYLDDTARGIDIQIRDDSKGMKSKMYPEKY